MRLKGSDGSSFDMRLVGYEFPELETEEYDSNWLRVKIDVVHPQGRWTSVDPSLLTYEVTALADWFESIADGDRVDKVQSFLEPNLSFHLVDDSAHGLALRVYFELESRPTWAKVAKALVEDLWVEFPLAEIDARAVAHELRNELSRFPQRAAR